MNITEWTKITKEQNPAAKFRMTRNGITITAEWNLMNEGWKEYATLIMHDETSDQISTRV